MEPFLTYADDRALREKGFADVGGCAGTTAAQYDNNAIVTRILAIRAAKAQLLGFPTFAHYRLADAMAKTPDAAMNLMLAVWEPAKAAVRQGCRRDADHRQRRDEGPRQAQSSRSHRGTIGTLRRSYARRSTIST